MYHRATKWCTEKHQVVVYLTSGIHICDMSIVQVLFIYLALNYPFGSGTDSCVECMSIPMPSLVDVDNESAFAIAISTGLIHYDFAHADPMRPVYQHMTTRARSPLSQRVMACLLRARQCVLYSDWLPLQRFHAPISIRYIHR